MRRSILAMLLLGSCAPSTSRSCASPWPGVFRGSDDAFWQTETRWIAPPAVHVVRIDRANRLTLNGEAATDREVDRYLATASGLAPQPYVSIDFEKGAGCAAIDRQRTAIERHFACEESRRCLQGPAPSWAR